LNQGSPVWHVITHLGAASIVLPLLLVAVVSLWLSGQRGAVRNWLLALAAASGVTLFSKIIFLGWGIGIASIDFTGLSGHALLATAVLPVLFGWLWAPLRGRFNRAWAAFGLLLGVLVAVSRVVLGAHSASEVILGCLAGVLVSGVALKSLSEPTHRPWLARLSVLILSLALVGDIASYLPTHDWEKSIALSLSGRSKPFSRKQMHQEARRMSVSQPVSGKSPQ